jgi:excisionase family DNA binding protein
MKNYYSTGEAAKIMGVSRVTVFRKIKEGTIKAEKIGRNFIIPADQLPTTTVVKATNEEINTAVKRAVKEFGKTLKQLGEE